MIQGAVGHFCTINNTHGRTHKQTFSQDQWVITSCPHVVQAQLLNTALCWAAAASSHYLIVESFYQILFGQGLSVNESVTLSTGIAWQSFTCFCTKTGVNFKKVVN